jgi:predicted RNA-binding protein with PUA domain
MTNCKNCGAPLHGNKCEYCGTEYSDRTITGNIPRIGDIGILKVGDEEIKVYIGAIETNGGDAESWRDAEGMLHRTVNSKRKFTLIEI